MQLLLLRVRLVMMIEAAQQQWGKQTLCLSTEILRRIQNYIGAEECTAAWCGTSSSLELY